MTVRSLVSQISEQPASKRAKIPMNGSNSRANAPGGDVRVASGAEVPIVVQFQLDGTHGLIQCPPARGCEIAEEALRQPAGPFAYRQGKSTTDSG